MKTKLLLLFFILHLAQLNAQNSKELLLSSAGKSVCECLKEKSEVNYLDLFPCITNFANNSSDEIYKVYQDKGEHFIDTFVVHAVLHTYDHCPAIVQQAIIEIYVSFVALQVCECLKKSGSVLDKTSLDRQNCISDAKLAGQPQLEIILRDQENKEEFLANLEKELQASFKENCPGFFTTIEYDKNDREELLAGVIIQRANSQGEAIIAAENLEEFLKNNPEDWEVAYILMQTLFDYTDLNDKVVQLGEELLARKNSKQPYYEAQVQMYKGLGILYGAYKKDQLLTTLNLAKTELEKVPSDYPNYPNVEVHLNLVWVYSLLKDKENTYNNILRSAQLAERQEDKKMLMLMLGKLNEDPEFFFQGIEMVWGKPK